MGLQSFSYGIYEGYDVIPEEVINLFKDATTDADFEYEMEIIKAGMKGKINFNQSFNLRGYNKRVKQHYELRKYQKKDGFYLVSDAEESITDKYAINVGNVPDYVNRQAMGGDLRTAYEQVEDDLELKDTISRIKDLNEDLLVYEHIDFVETLKGAVKGIAECVETVREVCEKYAYVSTCVKSLLSAGKPIDVLLTGV